MLPGWDIAVDVTPAALDAAFARAAQAGKPAKAALLVSPTYFGTTSDIPGAVYAVHQSLCLPTVPWHVFADIAAVLRIVLMCRIGGCLPPPWRTAACG